MEGTIRHIGGTRSSRVYVRVAVDFDEEGNMRPRSLEWEDGVRYDIDQIVNIAPAYNPRVGGAGDRYAVRISGKITYLYFEHSYGSPSPVCGRWFVERRAT